MNVCFVFLIEGFSALYDMWNQVPLKRLMTAASSKDGFYTKSLGE